MEISFDASKDETNRAKHGVSLGDAAGLDWDQIQVTPDLRKDYGEDRLIGLAPLNGRLYCVVFVERDNGRRIISFRKANLREMDSYAKNQTS